MNQIDNNMEQVQKSLSALDRAFAKLGKSGVEEIINKIDSLNIQGPTVEEYFSEFEQNFANLFEDLCIWASESTSATFTFPLIDCLPNKVDVKTAFTECWYEPDKLTSLKNSKTTGQTGGFFI